MLKFAKYHGIGNDFLVVDGSVASPAPRWPEVARGLCERHRGVGADGLIVALPGSGGSDLTMLLYNADGGLAEMSGNGIRCLALFAREAGIVAVDDFVVSTGAGLRRVEVGPITEAGLATVRVDMGVATVDEVDLLVEDPRGGSGWRGRAVDVGNPHLVMVCDNLETLDLGAIGPALEAGRPGGVNLEWVRARPGAAELDLAVWERGVGPTLACGTGSVAAAAAGLAMGLLGARTVKVHNPGGTLTIDCSNESAWLVGPAQRIAWLEVDLEVSTAERAPGPQPEADDWAVVAEGAVEWGWNWASGAGWGTPKG
ncbi:MAG: diaminopimelate epimerase [Acidimicrobiales bacterium]